MKVYLVGGAVRDHLLNYPVKERDWVVVGGSPELLLQKGYKQVGRDFPVFIHPNTHEEYALARTERKVGQGYHGFVCDTNPQVTLEEDLARRDLTINAIAMDMGGQIIDPYHGQADIKGKWLRHVSKAFVEDPIRVLRVARFAARYQHLGFRLAEETRQLMYQMVRQGELQHLIAERVWQEWQRSLKEKNPEVFIEILRACGALKIVLPELDALFGVPNSQHYHPEVDSGIHTLMVLRAATALSPDPVVRFAALVHDLGKAKTPMQEWPSHKKHEIRGMQIITDLCQRLRIPTAYRHAAVLVSQFHLTIHKLYELNARTIVSLLEKIDAFRRQSNLEILLIACEADAQGTGRPIDYTQAKDWYNLWQECVKINASKMIEAGYEGEAIKQALHRARIACIKSLIKPWKMNEK